MSLSPGTRLGHYDVTALLGEGGHPCSIEPDTGRKGLHGGIEGPFTPRKNFDGVHRNEHLVQALMLISVAIADLIALEFTSPLARTATSPLARTASFRKAIPFLFEEQFGLAFLISAGFKRARAIRVLKTVDAESMRPQLHPGKEDPHALTELPVFAVVHGSQRISLAQVAQLFPKGAPIPYFDGAVRGFSRYFLSGY